MQKFIDEVQLSDFTKEEVKWLCALIEEKLIAVGHYPEGFAFNINVKLSEERVT